MHPQNIFSTRVLSCAVALLVAGAFLMALPSAQAQIIYGNTSAGVLFKFSPDAPGNATFIGNIGFTPEGIDFADGKLYAIDIGLTLARLYTINITTAAATPIGSGFPIVGTVPAPYDLSESTSFGFDVTPTVNSLTLGNRIRLVSDDGDNLRLNELNGGVAAVDPLLYHDAAAATGAAFTSLGGLVLINVDTDAVYNVSPSGALGFIGVLGFNFSGPIGFDIVRNPTTQVDTGYLVGEARSTVPGTELYTVDYGLGRAARVGTGQIGPGLQIIDIAVQPAVPEPNALTMMLLSAALFGLRRRRRRMR